MTESEAIALAGKIEQACADVVVIEAARGVIVGRVEAASMAIGGAANFAQALQGPDGAARHMAIALVSRYGADRARAALEFALSVGRSVETEEITAGAELLAGKPLA